MNDQELSRKPTKEEARQGGTEARGGREAEGQAFPLLQVRLWLGGAALRTRSSEPSLKRN